MIGEIVIHRNYRVGENEFKPECCCDFCASNFNTYLIKIPDTKKYVCGKCLDTMSKAIDQAQVNDFQSDFEISRGADFILNCV